MVYCDRAVTQDRSISTLDTRAFLHLRRGEFQAALDDYRAALAKHQYASAAYGRGIAELRLGREAEGRANLAKAIKMQPDVAAIYARRGIVP